ncbi:uncharacterized protein CXQ87_000079 [Candidozyma duobushaemuli]|uniref:UBX domain-containing protein n=2 Tax=Candidozyma TaxID=3303203 RepID=A0ABX8I3Y7_9ASCO|nr:uncharacterized protein CXQ87_000079 [[Candida] duobushaemulonis]PVH17198.1 hypothetical protein CXQ87_000079 [[Candida] duobushaemulonis]QWU85858.1 hypothetical protein CA3LBN_000076 [[Candida] haemuloni]
MDNDIATFLAFTGTEDEATAQRFLELTGNNVEYAVQLFMESGANGATGGSSGNAGASSNDEDIAQRLQQEAYQENVRDADTNVHRHETLMDSWSDLGAMQNPVDRIQDMFGRGRVGVFNQRFEEEDDMEDYDDADDSDEPQIVELDDEDDEEGVVDLDRETLPPRNRRSRVRQERMNDLTSTQRRLAQLFKPPFDLIERTNLDGAKQKGRAEKKWILMNIQDQSEFQCQVLNRDFWSKPEIKKCVKENFIFLQFQHDSVNGESYVNFYHTDSYPHISILDPMTGERVKKWTDGEVPDPEEWLADVELFLEKFSLVPGSNNPHVKHEVKFDPDAMSEEQQIEFAMRQSAAATEGKTAEDAIAIDEEEAAEEPAEEKDAFESIEPKSHTEPTAGSVTRIQFRFPNGKRLIHKFDFENDSVLTIFQWLKQVLADAEESAYGISSSDRFTISSVGKPKLLESLHETIGAMGLKNASILLEKE